MEFIGIMSWLHIWALSSLLWSLSASLESCRLVCQQPSSASRNQVLLLNFLLRPMKHWTKGAGITSHMLPPGGRSTCLRAWPRGAQVQCSLWGSSAESAMSALFCLVKDYTATDQNKPPEHGPGNYGGSEFPDHSPPSIGYPNGKKLP